MMAATAHFKHEFEEVGAAVRIPGFTTPHYDSAVSHPEPDAGQLPPEQQRPPGRSLASPTRQDRGARSRRPRRTVPEMSMTKAASPMNVCSDSASTEQLPLLSFVAALASPFASGCGCDGAASGVGTAAVVVGCSDGGAVSGCGASTSAGGVSSGGACCDSRVRLFRSRGAGGTSAKAGAARPSRSAAAANEGAMVFACRSMRGSS
jgi:hypothetical protein